MAMGLPMMEKSVMSVVGHSSLVVGQSLQ